MANPEHLKILKQGVEVWNEWRNKNSNILPNLEDANLHKADLYRVNLSQANLIGAELGEAELYEANLYGAELIGVELNKADLRGANLRHADLRHAGLYGADLYGADLYGADLSEADLHEANLSIANLGEVNLSGADLSITDLSSSILSSADLSGTDLFKTNFSESKLEDTIFNNSTLNKTILGLTDLSTCIGLDTVKVSGNCVIDFQTLSNSKNLPKDFLFKLGLPETYIDYLPGFYDEKPLRLFPVFISHSSTDKNFTGKLYEALIGKRVSVWYDEHKLKPGDDILDSIDKGINVYDKMILVCSKSSLDSWWVEEELERIFEKERQYRTQHGKKHRLLIPITIDDEILNSKAPLAKSIRKRSIGEFQNWQDDQQFTKALEDLIAALNADRGNDEPLSFL